MRGDQHKIVKDNVYTLLQKLSKEYRLGIISNYSASMAKYLQEVDLAKYFDEIVISAVVGYEKPDTRIYDYFLNKMNCEAKDCLYVGDHPFDVLGAKRSGMDMAWLNNIYDDMPEYIKEKPDYVLKDIGELIEILQADK